MLPREHGAYGQMLLPLVTSLVVAGVTTEVVLIATAVIASFLAHEPLLVILGRRGMRAKREHERRAAIWLAVVMTAAVVAGVSAFWSVPRSVRWSFSLPLLPAAFVIVAIARGREKSAAGETAAALSFSSAATPICLAADAPIQTAVAVGVAFAAISVASTLAVRVILQARRSDDSHAASLTRFAVLAVATTTVVGFSVPALRAIVPWSVLMAVVPGLGAAVWLAMRPPSPTRLRAVGWTLMLTSTATAVILAAGLASRW